MTKKKETIISAALIVALFAVLYLMEQTLPATSMLFTVLKKGAIYALVAVSMNLLNGFTGLFSLGQAGFMLLGAYTYGILTIPVESRESVYMYFEGARSTAIAISSKSCGTLYFSCWCKSLSR